MLKTFSNVLGVTASLLAAGCAPIGSREPRLEPVRDVAAFEQHLAGVIALERDNRYLEGGGPIGPVAARRIVLGDGQPDLTVALMVGDGWCGSGGCHLAVVQGDGDEARLVGWSTISRPPVQVLPSRNHGLPDLSVLICGGGIMVCQHSILSFNGETYPLNPSMPPAIIVDEQPEGLVVISEEDAAEAVGRRPPRPPFEIPSEVEAPDEPGPWVGDPDKAERLPPEWARPGA